MLSRAARGANPTSLYLRFEPRSSEVTASVCVAQLMFAECAFLWCNLSLAIIFQLLRAGSQWKKRYHKGKEHRKRTIVSVACALIAPLTFAQTKKIWKNNRVEGKKGQQKSLSGYTMARARRQARRAVREARRVPRRAARQSRRTGRRVARRVRRVGRRVARKARRTARKGARRVRRTGRRIGRAKRIIIRATEPGPGEETRATEPGPGEETQATEPGPGEETQATETGPGELRQSEFF